jgi:hypothetical protein
MSVSVLSADILNTGGLIFESFAQYGSRFLLLSARVHFSRSVQVYFAADLINFISEAVSDSVISFHGPSFLAHIIESVEGYDIKKNP